MRQPLNQLAPGTRFHVRDLGITGTLLMVNECRARVRIDQPQQDVELTDTSGATRTFRASRNIETSWAPTVLVEALSIDPQHQGDTTMSKKTTTKKTAAKTTKATKATPKKATPKKATKAPAKKREGKMSALDAAAKVLADSKEPLNTKAMIEQMAAKGLWTSPGGKTPHATLYSAILREINDKGADARFVKADRGLFTIKK
jgi:hypothetical protein